MRIFVIHEITSIDHLLYTNNIVNRVSKCTTLNTSQYLIFRVIILIIETVFFCIWNKQVSVLSDEMKEYDKVGEQD